MNYYQMSPNPKSRKWKGYQVPNPDVWNDENRLSDLYLRKHNCKWDFENLIYKNLVEGKIPPVHHLGTSFIMFDSNISNVKSIESCGMQLFPIVNIISAHMYYILNVYEQVDCVDWESSDVDKWGEDDKIEEWHNKRGRWFLNPILIKDKIPPNIDAFRLHEWGGAFNIIISERLKDKICYLDFDKAFLEFKCLEVI